MTVYEAPVMSEGHGGKAVARSSRYLIPEVERLLAVTHPRSELEGCELARVDCPENFQVSVDTTSIKAHQRELVHPC